jgi:thioredoxin reductase
LSSRAHPDNPVRMDEIYDVVVVGGSAAGLSGAVALARSRRSVLVVDAGDPRNAPAGHVHNFLTRDGAPPGELYAAGRAEVARYGGRVETGRVTALSRDGDRFGVHIGSRTVVVRRLLLTTGPSCGTATTSSEPTSRPIPPARPRSPGSGSRAT